MSGARKHSIMDPEWSPPVLVTRRLHDASTVHASRLAEQTTIESAARAGNNNSKAGDDDTDGGDGGIHPLAKISLSRSSCPQPPLDDGITGGGSSVSCDVHFSGMNVRLDPLERCAPHRIVVPQTEEDDRNRGELDGSYNDAQVAEQRSATWNAVTVLSTLCEEVQELDGTFQSKILPSIVLFTADDDAAVLTNRPHSKKDMLDDEAQERRESALLSRIGKFLPALQLASNGTTRLRRLVKNMVVQLGAVQTPSATPFYYDQNEEQEGGGGSSNNEDDGLSASVTNNGASTNNGPANGTTETTNRARGEGEESMQPPVFGPGVPMFRLGKAIAIALRIAVSVDTAISNNADLQEAWAMYKDVVMEMSEQKRMDNTLDSQFESFERMMVQLDFNLLSSRSFISAIEQNFDPRGRFQSAKFPLYDELKAIVVTLYNQYCERINTEQETNERLDCVGIYGMYVLYRHLLPPNVVPDAKLHKSLWAVFPAMCPIMELYGPLVFIPREFMMTYAPYKAVKGCSADVPEIRAGVATMVLKWNGSFGARVDKIRLEALGWLAMADSELSPTVPLPHSQSEDDDGDIEEVILASSVASIEAATTCILRGIKIAYSASIVLRSQLVAHRALGLAYNGNHLPSLISLMEVLKSIEKMLCVRSRSAVLSFQRSTLKMIAQNILKRFDKVRSFVDHYSSSGDFSRNSDRARSITRVSACLTALEGVLKGSSSFSPIRRHSIAFSIAACMDTMILEVFTTNDLLAVEGHLKDLSQISSVEETLNQVCDCSFLYFYRDMFPQFVDVLYQTSLNSAVIHTQLVLSAFSDSERILKNVRHVEYPSDGVSACVAGYRKFILNTLREEYAGPICELIETDLRLAASGARGIDNRLRKFISCPPLYICQSKWDVKSEVEKYLEGIFYDLCTLNLNDCNTYNEMRTIANERYGLNLTDPYLPDGSLDQGVDFIDILRNLDSFISQNNYNSIEQSFVERRPERGAKFLNTMNIKTISASLRQHGLGVVNAAVNICYKLLTRKFQLFTDLLANDNVKSLLSRELRWFDNQKSEGNTVYPFGRASTFAQEIKKLEADSGNNALDECRVIISEMGNIIAFVRMIRAAKRRLLTDEMPFLSSYNTSDVTKFTNKSKTNDAKAGVDAVVSNILLKPDPDFVRTLVNVFRSVIQKQESDNSFMGSFFCIVPALCLCWMETSIQGKEMMHKKNITRDGYYTDDGFSVGLAFALSVLGQTKIYEGLNWFKSIQSKYAADEEDLLEKNNVHSVKRKAKMAASKQSSWFSSSAEDSTQDEDEELTILKLMGKRLEGHRREMAMLFFSMHGAETFFKDVLG